MSAEELQMLMFEKRASICMNDDNPINDLKKKIAAKPAGPQRGA